MTLCLVVIGLFSSVYPEHIPLLRAVSLGSGRNEILKLEPELLLLKCIDQAGVLDAIKLETEVTHLHQNTKPGETLSLH